MCRLSIIIPAYNEERRLGRTLAATIAHMESLNLAYELIVVDDGSTDGTAGIVAEMAGRDARLRLIRLAQNGGKGLAVRSGIVNAAGERILFMDADAATALEEIGRIFDLMTETNADIVIGSRAHLPGSHTTVKAKWFRHFAGRIFHQFVRAYGVKGIVDTQCGFKLFTRRAATAIASRMRMHGYSFDVEMLLIGRNLGFEIVELSVNWTHQDGSKVAVVPDGLRMVNDLLRIRRNAARGLYRTPRIGPPQTESTVSGRVAG
ncbi:MAG: dolichyl-phosphate beta-glucosyltransferase [Gemmatimonadaceae bacterium]